MRFRRFFPPALGSCLAAFSAAMSCAPPPAGAATTSERLQTLARAITFDWAKEHPLVATSLGLSDEDGRLDSPSLGENARDLAQIRRWEAQLAAIPLAGASLVDADDAKLLRAQLVGYERQYTTYKTFEKDPSGPSQAIVGAVFTQFQQLPIAGRDGATAADLASAWDKIIARLEGAPAYIEAGNALVVRPGHLFGVTGAEQLAGAPDFFNGALTDAAKAQLSADRFADFERARDGTLRAIAKTKAYIDAHVARWPENYAIGRPAYDAMLRDEQLLPFTTADVERMGRDELAHGWAVQTWVEHDAEERHTTIGPASGGGLAPGGPALIDYYRARLAELTAFVTQHHVVDVPAWLGSVDVVETPKFLQPVSPGASMNPPLLFGKSAKGYYFITPPKSLADAAAKLDPNQDFDRDRILSTGAHEAMPGHFLQFSIARRQPDFVRKIASSGSFAEGWAFYGEEMFVQLGLYGDDLDGRYYTAQWERVRGARAIVDPELASGAWSYDRAVAFFSRETGFPVDEAKAAIAGIALGPGYVISYTVGRAQVETLLAEYRAKAGTSASLLDFHDRLLCYGTTPLSVVGPELLADLAKPLDQVRAAAGY